MFISVFLYLSQYNILINDVYELLEDAYKILYTNKTIIYGTQTETEQTSFIFTFV